jgi:hypothetical protein
MNKEMVNISFSNSAVQRLKLYLCIKIYKMSKQVRVRFAPSPTYILAEFVLPYSLFVCQENNGVFFYGLKIPTKIGLFQVPKLISWKH